MEREGGGSVPYRHICRGTGSTKGACMSEVLKMVDWRQQKYDKVCPECLSALIPDLNVESSMGRMATYECGGCGRREMIYERPKEKVREY